jgi:RNA polymerase sigma-70 factor (ECF subfamily)
VGIEQAAPLLPRLRRYARLLTRDATRADDLVQDTLERAHHKWPLFRPRQAPAAGPADNGLLGWLLTLMHNLHLNQVRDHARDEGHAELDDEAVSTADPSQDHASTTLHRLDLERALAELPPALQQVILLVCVEDFSYAEAAEATGVPVGTVMSRLSRARTRLRELMAGEAPEARPGHGHLRAVR